ncbi:MAG: SHOCT domain-containing protein, partial [Bacilli bacterium]|nr:SHOCT domain-containing protein [Bacilli bacterium]
FIAFTVLSFVGYIMSMVANKRAEKNKGLDELYTYKKLLDDGLITQEEYNAVKEKVLKQLSKPAEE